MSPRLVSLVSKAAYLWPLVLLEILCRVSQTVALVVAPPSSVILELVKQVWQPPLRQAIWETLIKVSIASLAAVCIGYPLGFVVGMSGRAHRALARPVDAARAIPTVLLIPVFMLVMNPGETLVTMMAAYPAVGLVFVETANAVASCGDARGRMCRALGMRFGQYAKDFVFWETLPTAVVAIASALPVVVALVVALEYFEMCECGLGQFVSGSRQLRGEGYLTTMYTGIAAVGIIGVLAAYAPRSIGRRLVRWATWT